MLVFYYKIGVVLIELQIGGVIINNINLPKYQKIVMQYSRDGKLTYIVTQHIMNCIYTLFSVDDDNKLAKIKTANKPTDFKEVYP